MRSMGTTLGPSASATTLARAAGMSGSSQPTSRPARATAASILLTSKGTSVPSRRRTFAGHPAFDADFIALSQKRLLALIVGDGRLHGPESMLRTLVGVCLLCSRDDDRVRARKNGRLVVGGEPPHHIRWCAIW